MSSKQKQAARAAAVIVCVFLAVWAVVQLGVFVPKLFDIQMTVDFGPAGRPAFNDHLQVERGTTPKEAVSQIFAVRSGKSCCSLREVLEIDGVAIDPAQNRWWVCSVNGDRKWVTAYGTKLKPGDRVVWRYIQDAQ